MHCCAWRGSLPGSNERLMNALRGPLAERFGKCYSFEVRPPVGGGEVIMSANLKSVSTTPEAERQARIDLAACYRLADHFGLNEGIDNHMTMLVPGHADRFLLAPFGLHWSEVKASDFMVMDFAGQMLSGRGPIEDTALLHSSARASAGAAGALRAAHPHAYATALTMLENPRLEMAVQSALGFYEDVAYDPNYNGLAFDYTEGERMARVLGTKSVLMLGNHGVLVVGETVPQAFERLYFLERACSGAGARALDRAAP